MGVARLKGLQVEEGTICDAPMNPRARMVLFKRRGTQEEDMSKKVKKNEGEQDPLAALEGLSDEQKQAIAQVLAAKDEQIAQLQSKAGEGEGEGEGEEKKKAEGSEDDEDKEANKAVAKARAEVAELRKALATEQSARLDREYLEKARAYSAIPVPPERVGSLMRAVSTLEKSHGEALEMVLKSCDAMARQDSTITKSLGVANGVTKSGSARDDVEAYAAKLMAGDPKMKKTAAIAKAWSDNPELAKRHREETARK